MQEYVPPFSITSRMLDLVAAIAENAGRADACGVFAMPRLRRANRISSIHASLKIEANSLSEDQVSALLDGTPVVGNEHDILEVRNAHEAYAQLPSVNPFDIRDLKRMHGIMARGLVEGAGAWRTGNEGVFEGARCIFMAPPPHMVPSLMEDLFQWMNRCRSTVHPLIMGAVFHYEFVFIHPFADGNGRMARLWHTALLASWRPLFAWLPIESRIADFQQGYYEAIAACHAAGNSDAFIEFMLARINESLALATEARSAGSPVLPPGAARLAAVMERGREYTATELVRALSMKSREAFRLHYLRPAIDAGAVVMTNPDRPSSRNQRYRLA